MAKMENPKNHICALDIKKGFFVKPIRTNQQDEHPVVFVAPLREAIQFSDLMNKQFEIH